MIRTEPLDVLDVGVALPTKPSPIAPRRLHRAARDAILHRQGLPDGDIQTAHGLIHKIMAQRVQDIPSGND